MDNFNEENDQKEEEMEEVINLVKKNSAKIK